MPYTNDTKPTSTFVNDMEPRDNGFLLKEDVFYLLLETGFKIIINTQDFVNDSLPSAAIYTFDVEPT